jgi:hypothetical protein
LTLRVVGLKLPPKVHACANSHRFFVDNQPEKQVHAHIITFGFFLLQDLGKLLQFGDF